MSEILLWYVRCGFLYFSCLDFLNLWMMYFIHFGKFTAVIFLNIASAAFSLLLRKEMNTCLYYPCLLPPLWHATFIYLPVFTLCSVSWSTSPVHRFFLAVPNQWLYSSTEFLILIVRIFSSKISILFLFKYFSFVFVFQFSVEIFNHIIILMNITNVFVLKSI